jgi:hypothetical protein
MKPTATRNNTTEAQVLDIHQPEEAAKLSEAYARERANIQAALAELETVRYASRPAREATALATMGPMPGHALMDRAPREILRLRAALLLLSAHAHRRN